MLRCAMLCRRAASCRSAAQARPQSRPEAKNLCAAGTTGKTECLHSYEERGSPRLPLLSNANVTQRPSTAIAAATDLAKQILSRCPCSGARFLNKSKAIKMQTPVLRRAVDELSPVPSQPAAMISPFRIFPSTRLSPLPWFLSCFRVCFTSYMS